MANSITHCRSAFGARNYGVLWICCEPKKSHSNRPIHLQKSLQLEPSPLERRPGNQPNALIQFILGNLTQFRPQCNCGRSLLTTQSHCWKKLYVVHYGGCSLSITSSRAASAPAE